MEERVQKVLREFEINSSVSDVVKLHGDASYRTYYRVVLEGGGTYIVMEMPVGKASASEEITNFKGPHKEPPFINIARFLSSLSLRVPKVYGYKEEERLMILEDVGDNLLGNLIKEADAVGRELWYKKAIDLLVEVQSRTTGAKNADCVALKRSFDAVLLNWEFDHFREYLIEARMGKEMKPSDRTIFEKETRKITEEILKMPYCFVHRDFQSRNLMVQPDGAIAILDFQDALMGPYVYDLVSLLRDSYVELEWDLVERLVKYYSFILRPWPPRQGRQAQDERDQNPSLMVSLSNHERLLEHFHLIVIQRKMKDAGRFVYIDRVKKNPNFLQYIPTSLKYVENAFRKTIEQSHHRTIAPVFDILKPYVPEWQ